MNCKEAEVIARSVLNDYTDICLDRLRKNTKHIQSG
jgi:hypothetical protein